MIDPVRITLLLSSVARREPQQKLSSVKHMLRCIYMRTWISAKFLVKCSDLTLSVDASHPTMTPSHDYIASVDTCTDSNPPHIKWYREFFFIPVAFCFLLIYCVSNIQESAIVSWVPFHIDTQIWSKTRCSEETGSLYHCFHPNTQN